MKDISFETQIEIEGVPRKWIPLIQLFDSNLPTYPLMYIHFVHKKSRVYGFPVSFSIMQRSISLKRKDERLKLNFTFESNKNLDENCELKCKVRDILKQRIGLTNCVTNADIMNSSSDPDLLNTLKEIWKKVSLVYGFFNTICSIRRVLFHSTVHSSTSVPVRQKK